MGDQLGASKLAIKSRLEKAERAYGALRSVLWGQNEISTCTKVKVFKAIVMSVMLYAIKTHKAMDAEMRPLRHFCLRKLKSLFGLSHDAHTSYEDMDQILKEHQIAWKWPDRIIREQRLEFFLKQIRRKEIGHILRPEEGVRRKRGGLKRRMIDAIQMISKHLKST